MQALWTIAEDLAPPDRGLGYRFRFAPGLAAIQRARQHALVQARIIPGGHYLPGGVGAGLAYLVPVAVSVAWFPRHKGLVTGIAV